MVELQHFNAAIDLEKIIPLIREEYPNGEMSDFRYLSWEYFANPQGPPELVCARSEKDEVVGQYLVIPIRYQIDGKSVDGSLSLNTLTRADYRGQGLFTKMAKQTYAQCKKRGLALTVGFPNMSSFPGFVKKLEFVHIGNAVLLVRPLQITSLVIGALKRHKYPKYQSYREPNSLGHIESFRTRGIEISTFDLEKDANIYKSYLASRGLLYQQTDRSLQYLKWRYQDIPTRSYSLLKATRNGRFLAMAVIRLRKVYGMEAGFYIDFNCLPDDESLMAARALDSYCRLIFKAHGAVFVGVLMAPNCAEFRVLRKQGFFQAPKRFLPHSAPVIVRWNGDGSMPNSLKSIYNWFLTFGDYDAF